MLIHRPCVALLSLTAAVCAQEPSRPARLSNGPLVPIHTQPADPAAGAYGTWAAGADYKVAFERGIAFYPLLGRNAAKSLPLRWRTLAIAGTDVGAAAGGEAPAVRATEWRYEVDHGVAVEAYDVRGDGVEQSFRIEKRPAGGGDLVVRGAIETELQADAVHAAAPVAFRDGSGAAVLEYGKAVAIDATGARSDVRTDFDGRTLALTVPAAFVAEATFPLVIDPLLARYGAASGVASVNDEAIATFPGAVTGNLLVAHVRWVSATDADLYVFACNSDWSAPHLVCSDVTSGWSTPNVTLCAVEGAATWAIGMARDFGSATWVRVYLHAQSDTGLNTGTLLAPANATGTTRRYPAIGGATGSGTKALLVFQTDTTATQQNTTNSAVNAILVDAVAKGYGAAFLPFVTSLGADMDREYPCVSHAADNGGSWIVGWQERNNTVPNALWDVVGARVRSDGVAVGGSLLSAGGNFHKVRPRIDGQAGRYLLGFHDSTTLNGTSSKTVYTRRIDWDEAAQAATLQPQLAPLFVQNGYVGDFDVAYDFVTRSHWALVTRTITNGIDVNIEARRLGFSGAPVETALAMTSQAADPVLPRVAYRKGTPGDFVLVYSSNDSANITYLQAFTFAAAGTSIYGTGCGGSVVLDVPYAGNEFYKVKVTGIAPSKAAVLFLAGTAGATSLAPIGMPGCWLNVGAIAVQVPTLSSAAGVAELTFKLPDAPVAIGDLYSQWVWMSPGSNALGVSSSQGVKHMVR